VSLEHHTADLEGDVEIRVTKDGHTTIIDVAGPLTITAFFRVPDHYPLTGLHAPTQQTWATFSAGADTYTVRQS
jgi:hypothetical protein